MVRKYKSKKRKYSKKIKKHLRSHKRKRSMKKRRVGGREEPGKWMVWESPPGGWTTWGGTGSKHSTSRRRPASPPPEPALGTYESSKYAVDPDSSYWRERNRAWPPADPHDIILDPGNEFREGTGELVRPRPSPTKSSTKSLIGKKKSRPTIYGPCKICRKGKGNCNKRGQSGHLKKKKH